MNKKDINIIDIRDYTRSNTEILNFEDGKIIFAKEDKLDDKQFYTINNYDYKTNKVNVLYKYEIPEWVFNIQHAHIVGDEIIIIKMHLKK